MPGNSFSFRGRLNSFKHAFRGIAWVIRTQHNMWIHLVIGSIAVLFAWIWDFSRAEWLILILTIGAVLITEMINSAIEESIDLMSPEYHIHAKRAKDASAGAVLLTCIMAVMIGIILFLPKLLICIGYS